MNSVAFIVAQKDGSAGELIAWIVIGIIWAIAQVVQKARQKRQWNQPQKPATPRTTQHLDLEEFFEQLQKQHEEAALPQPDRPPAEPPPAMRRTPPPPPVSTPAPRHAQPPPTPLRVRQKPKPVRVPFQPEAQQPTPPARPQLERILIAPIPEIAALPSPVTDFYPVERGVAALRTGMPATRAGLEIKDTTMRGLKLMPDNFRLATPAIRKMFHGKQALRQSFISRFVLGPPRSQQAWDYPQT